MSSVILRNVSFGFGDTAVLQQLNLSIDQGELVVLLGPSGCGKSTLLNCIAGLVDVSEGQVIIGNRNVTWEEPAQRRVGMVFQSYALYPHMSVEKNLSFGLRVAGLSKKDVAERVGRVADMLQINSLLKRKPAALSGGQKQRVAIGRALVRDVDVFLMDEPLSNLDARLRNDLRVEIKRLHRRLGNTMIYVTHDQIEALTLADKVAVMKDGVIQQFDTPDTVYNNPVNRFVAGFVGSTGINFMDGVVTQTGGALWFDMGERKIPLNGCSPGKRPVDGQSVVLAIRSEHLSLGESTVGLPVVMPAVFDLEEPMGADTVAWVRLGDTLVSVRIESGSGVSAGEAVTIGFDPVNAFLFDETGNRL